MEAQKGPESLQEALRVQAGNHRSQQDELRTLIDSLRVTLSDAFTQKGGKGSLTPDSLTAPLSALKDLRVGSQKTQSLLESLSPQLGQLEQGLGRVEGELSVVRRLLDATPQADVPAGERLQAAAERGAQWEPEVVVRRLEDTQRTLGDQIRTNTWYNAVFTYTATAITVSAVYMLLRGAG